MNKVIIIITKGDTGGAQVSVYNLAKELRRQGVEVTVGFGRGEFLASKLKAAAIPFVNFKRLRRSYGIINALLFMLELRRYLKSNSFDVIHFNSSNTLFGALAAQTVAKKPLTVFTFRGLSIVDPEYTKKWILKKFYRLCFRFLLAFVDKQIYVSEQNRRYCQEIGLAKNETVIYNGLRAEDLKFTEKSHAVEKLEKLIGVGLNDRFIIGSIGRLSYQKNYEFLIKQAASDLHFNFAIIIIGDGPEKQKCQKLIQGLNLQNHVFLAGDIPDAYKYLKAFDLFVLPSRYEGLPITLIETLFAGVPALTTNVGGNKEVVGDAGELYELDNAKEFQMKLARLINDKNLREKLSLKALARSSLFSIKRTCEEYLKLYSRNT